MWVEILSQSLDTKRKKASEGQAAHYTICRAFWKVQGEELRILHACPLHFAPHKGLFRLDPGIYAMGSPQEGTHDEASLCLHFKGMARALNPLYA